MRVQLNPCYILHQRPYRETSMILDVLSREHGKLALVARGVKGRRKNQRALMQCNQLLNLGWSIRGEMGNLTIIEAQGMNLNLKGSELIAAFYMNELLMRLLHRHEPHPELFDAYHTALNELRDGIDEQHTLRVFEIRLLESLGYALVLDQDISTGQPVISAETYYYDPDTGPSSEVAGPGGHVKISGSTLKAMAAHRLTEKQHFKESKNLTRIVLYRLLGVKPLASRELFKAYLKTRRQPA